MGGRHQRWVVRQHGPADLARNPQIALHEFTLLQQLHAEKLPTPKPLYLDESREIFSDPVLVTEYIDGIPSFPSRPDRHAMISYVGLLLHIHKVTPERMDLSFLPQQAEIVAKKLEGITHTPEAQTEEEKQVVEALREAWPHVQQANPSVLLHGDYWPGNTLWQGEELVAVIDWENAAIGDPLADLANSRLEILWALGYNAMYDFTRQYHSRSLLLDTTNLPFWDLWAALTPACNMSTWDLAPSTERRMRAQLQDFIHRFMFLGYIPAVCSEILALLSERSNVAYAVSSTRCPSGSSTTARLPHGELFGAEIIFVPASSNFCTIASTATT